MRVPSSGLKIDNPAWPLLQAHISYWGVTTAAGNALGTTLVCAGLANEPSYDGLPVKILSGGAAGQVRTIQVHNGNTLTVGVAFTDSAGAVQSIGAGTLFVILSSLAGGGGPGPAPPEGLWYYGVVDAVPGANQFTIGSLAGLGAGKFDGATNPYYAFVLRDAGGAGAAPQGEQQAITAYVTATGVFTTAAFIAAVAVGDEILILHPDLATALIILADLAVPAADSVANVLERDVIGNKADTPSDDPDVNTLSSMRLLKSLMRAWKCIIPNIDISLAAIDNVLTTDPSAGAPDAENTIMDLPITPGTMYKLEDIIIKVSSYGTGTQITIRVWELLGGNARANYVNTHIVIVPTDYPITTYLTLVDITGKPAIVGDGIAITVVTDAGNTGALTCTYTYSTARVS